MKYFAFLLCLFIYSFCNSQTITFDKLLNTHARVNSIFQQGNDYYCGYAFYNSSFGAIHLDSIGNIKKFNEFTQNKKDSSIDIMWNAKQLNYNYFWFGLSLYDTPILNTVQCGYAVFTDTNLQETYVFSSFNNDTNNQGSRFFNVETDLENNVLFFSRIIKKDNRTAVNIKKYSKYGNYIWQKTDITKMDAYLLPTIKCSDNSGFLLGGAYSYDANSMGERRSRYVIKKYDFEGNMIWQKYYKDPIYKDTITTFLTNVYEIINADATNYIFVGNHAVFKIDDVGNIIWQKSNINGIKIIHLPLNNEFVILKDTSVVKIDNNGNVIWEKNYRKNYFGNTYLFKSITATKDGGFIFTLIENSNLRVIKTDCDGNVENPINCTYKSIENEMHIFPNFASVTINLEWNLMSTYKVHIYNSIGQLVYTNQFGNSNNLNINISAWAEGLYYIKSLDENSSQNFFQKMIKY